MIQRTCGELFLAQCRTKYLERWWLSAGVRQPSTAQRDWRSESTSTCSCGAECGEGARCRRPDWKRRHCTRKEFVCLFQEWCHDCWVPPWPRLWILCLCLCLALINTAIFLPSQSISYRRQTRQERTRTTRRECKPCSDGWAHPKNTLSDTMRQRGILR
jgi:hypothetical protein